MGTQVIPQKDGTYKVRKTTNNTITGKMSRAETILHFINRLSPEDFVKNYFAFPDQWGSGECRILYNEEGRNVYWAWYTSLKYEHEIYDKYLACVAELKAQVESEEQSNKKEEG